MSARSRNTQTVSDKGSVLPVDRLVVTFRGHDLGSEIIWGTAERPSDIRNLLGETKIGDLEMAVPVEKQVLGLQVAVDDVQRVQVVQGQGDFCGVELGDGVWKTLWTNGVNIVDAWGRLLVHTWDLRSKLKSSPPSMKSMTL